MDVLFRPLAKQKASIKWAGCFTAPPPTDETCYRDIFGPFWIVIWFLPFFFFFKKKWCAHFWWRLGRQKKRQTHDILQSRRELSVGNKFTHFDRQQEISFFFPLLLFSRTQETNLLADEDRMELWNRTLFPPSCLNVWTSACAYSYFSVCFLGEHLKSFQNSRVEMILFKLGKKNGLDLFTF